MLERVIHFPPEAEIDPELPAKFPVPLRSAFPINEKHMPIRDWIIPGLLLRKTFGVGSPAGERQVVADTATGDRDCFGCPVGWLVPATPEKVLIVNAEDDHDEMCRRLCAAARDMGVDQTQLVDRVYLADAPESIVICKVDHRNRGGDSARR